MGTYATSDGQDSLRILLVEHDSDAVAVVQLLLEHYGHQIKTAMSGKDALLITGEFRPQVIFTSIALEGSNGFELARQLRTRDDCANTHIVAFTGHKAELTPDGWERAGFDHVLRKPANIDDILDVLRGVRPS